MIKLFAIGRLCAEPELRTTTSGKSVTNFRLAIRTSMKDEENKYVSDFWNCTAWSGLADNIAKYCHKGDLVAIEGEPRQREYTDKNGQNVRVTDINISNLEFAGSPNRNGNNTAAAPAQKPAPKPIPKDVAEESGYADDLPF